MKHLSGDLQKYEYDQRTSLPEIEHEGLPCELLHAS